MAINTNTKALMQPRYKVIVVMAVLMSQFIKTVQGINQAAQATAGTDHTPNGRRPAGEQAAPEDDCAPVCAQALRTGDSAGAVYCSHPRGLCCVRVPCSVGTWECPVRAGVTVSPEANLAFVRFWALSLAIIDTMSPPSHRCGECLLESSDRRVCIRVTPPVCACILKRVCPQSHLSITVGRVTLRSQSATFPFTAPPSVSLCDRAAPYSSPGPLRTQGSYKTA